MKKFLKNSYSLLCLLMFLIVVFCIIVSAIKLGYEINNASIPVSGTSQTDYIDYNQKDVNNCIKEETLPDMKDYSNIIIAVYTAIIIALISITVTIYVFLKSALDRIIDENHYIKSIANEYKRIMSKCLSNYCMLSFFCVLIIIVYHVFFCSKTTFEMTFDSRIFIIVFYCVALFTNIITSVVFWKKCIKTEEQLNKIIVEKSNEIKLKIERFFEKILQKVILIIL